MAIQEDRLGAIGDVRHVLGLAKTERCFAMTFGFALNLGTHGHHVGVVDGHPGRSICCDWRRPPCPWPREDGALFRDDFRLRAQSRNSWTSCWRSRWPSRKIDLLRLATSAMSLASRRRSAVSR